MPKNNSLPPPFLETPKLPRSVPVRHVFRRRYCSPISQSAVRGTTLRPFRWVWSMSYIYFRDHQLLLYAQKSAHSGRAPLVYRGNLLILRRLAVYCSQLDGCQIALTDNVTRGA